MKTLSAAFATILTAACATPIIEVQAETEPATMAQETWRPVSPKNLLLINTIHGQTVIELNPEFAPAHVAQIRSLVTDGTYDGQRFYRVIDGFVAQGGLQDEAVITAYATLANENDRAIDARQWRSVC